MKKILALALLVSTTVVGAAPSAQAFPGDSVSLSVGNFTKVPSACVYHPYTVYVTVAPTTDDVWLDLRVTGPQNQYVDSDFKVVYDSGTYMLDAFICSSLHPTGTYTVSGTATAWDFSFNQSAVTVPPVTFTVSDPAPPPPPPPPPVLPTWDVTGKANVDKFAYLRKFGITLKAARLPLGYTQGRPLTWKVLVDGRLAKTVVQNAGDSKYFTTKKLSLSPPQHKLVIKRNGQKVYVGKMVVR